MKASGFGGNSNHHKVQVEEHRSCQLVIQMLPVMKQKLQRFGKASRIRNGTKDHVDSEEAPGLLRGGKETTFGPEILWKGEFQFQRSKREPTSALHFRSHVLCCGSFDVLDAGDED